ncbi:hypothetical protein [Fusobacterium nucleatum]|nr:hypothetical protein [Fusobacterium nucleatum]
MVLVIIAGICLLISIYLFVSAEYELSEKRSLPCLFGQQIF